MQTTINAPMDGASEKHNDTALHSADAERQRKIQAFTDLLKETDDSGLNLDGVSRETLYESKWEDYLALR